MMLVRQIKTRRAAKLLVSALLLGGTVDAASAQSRFEGHYRASLAGLPIGSGTWIVDFADDSYTMAVSGHASGLLKAFSTGDGKAAVRGLLSGTKLAPTSYAITVHTRTRKDEVKMTFAGGNVKEVEVEPPVDPDPARVPLTERQKRGVLDPITVGIVPAAAAGGVGPEVCRQTANVFDGRMRFDLALSYKRMEKVKTEKGYEGQAVVCTVTYQPLGGHNPERGAIKFLRNSRDMELWFAPVAGTKFVAMYRIIVPTILGPAMLEATRFNSTPRPAHAGSASRT